MIITIVIGIIIRWLLLWFNQTRTPIENDFEHVFCAPFSLDIGG